MEPTKRPPKTPKGVRYGGRAKGTPNKSTQAVLDLCKRKKYNPIEAMIKLAQDDKQSPDLRAKMHATVAEYSYPKRKAIEMEAEVSGKHEFVIMWGGDEDQA